VVAGHKNIFTHSEQDVKGLMYMFNDNKIEQFRQENSAWIRTLDYMQMENVHLKNRLAATAKSKLEGKLLEQVEYFLNNFLNKDAVIALLRHDIVNQDQTLETQWANDGLDKKWLSNQEKLRQDMSKMEKEFNKLKFEFNKFLAEIL
jgi:hypothetical protein